MKVTVDPLTGMPVITKNAPVVVSSSGGASGGVRSVRAGANVTVNNADPANPIISATGGGGGGGGDMYTAVYDVTNDGIVDNSQALNGQAASYYLARANHTGTQAATTITGLATVATSGDYNDLSNKPTIPAAYTDEQAQDAVGNILTDTSTVDFTYNDAGNAISAAVLDSPTVNGNNSTFLLSRANHTGTQAESTITGLVADLAAKEPTVTAGTTGQYYRGDKTFQTLDKTAVGLANVDNTSDANKPVSTAQQTALNLKANIASPTFTGTPSAPTPTTGDNTTNLATTAFVTTAVLNAASTYDDVKDYANLAAFPVTGAVDVLYMANDTNFVYRWGGSSYIQVGGGTPADATTGSKGIIQLAGDLAGTAAAPTIKSSVALSGAPTAPTATGGTNTTQIATTAFVTSALATDNTLDVHLAGAETITGAKTFSLPVKLTPQASAYAANTLVADSGTDSLTYFGSDPNVGLQIGQEDWIRVINNTGSTIANGAAVYLNGASGSLPTIALANASAGATTVCAGLTTESIANGATGFVTCIGNVNGLDTSGFTAGQTVYLSATTAGGLTATAPVAPNYRYRVGIVGVSSASVGTIHVTPSTAALGNGTANQLFGINTAGTGQELKSLVAGSNVTITPGTNTITIAATSAGGTTVNYYSPVLAQEFTYSASNIFTLSQTPGSILSVTIQGQVLQSSEYGVAGTNVTVTPASHTFASGDIVRVQYQATTAFSSTAGFTANIRTVTASTTVLATDRTVLVDTSAGAVTLTYPQTAGQEWKFKKITTDTNAMIITGATGQTEFAANITTTSTIRPSYTIQSNGTNGYAL